MIQVVVLTVTSPFSLIAKITSQSNVIRTTDTSNNNDVVNDDLVATTRKEEIFNQHHTI